MANRREVTPIDKGYAWAILLASSVSYMIMAGISLSIGILYTEFLAKYGAGSGNTAWIPSLQSFLHFGLGSLGNYLSEVFSFRKIVFTGGFLLSFGYLVSAFVPNIELLYFTLGVVAGIGGGFVYTPCSTIVSFYFKQKRGLASGIVTSGAGISTFIFPYFYRYIIDEYGLQGALLIISAVILNICAFAGLFRQPQDLKKEKFPKKAEMEKETSLINKPSIKTDFPTPRKGLFINFSLVRSPRFAMYSITTTLSLLTFAANMSIIPAYVVSIGLGKENATISVSMVGAMGIFFRPFFGWITDFNIINKKYILSFSSIMSGIAAIMIPFLKNFPALVIYGCVVGIFPSAFFSLMALMMLDCVRLDRLPSAMGMLCLIIAFGLIVSQPLMGWIEDTTGSWDMSFRVMGCINILSSVILLSEKIIEKILCFGQKTPDLVLDLEEANNCVHTSKKAVSLCGENIVTPSDNCMV